MNRRQLLKSLAALPLVDGSAGKAQSKEVLTGFEIFKPMLSVPAPLPDIDCEFPGAIYSLRFADGCIYHDKIRRSEFHIDINQQILVRPLLHLEVDQRCEKSDRTGHYAWESCKLANEHCVRGPETYSLGEIAEVYLYKNEEKQSDDSWYLQKITWYGGEDIRVCHVYGSTRL